MPAPLKLVFMGSDPIALPSLEWLAGPGSGIARLLAIYTQPDRPSGRGQKTAAGPIKQWAQARGLVVRQPEQLTPDECTPFAALQADVALVMAYGHILRDDFIGTPRLGALNLHASLLPKYRGASPIPAAIAGGDRETGVTLMRIVRRLDAGPMADAERVGIGPRETASAVEAKLAEACVPLLTRALPRLREGSLVFVPQEEAQATFCRRLTKEDGRLDFTAPAAALAARINGLFPWPGCTVEIHGVAVKLGPADVASGPVRDAAAGTVLGADAGGLLVMTGEGILRLCGLQRPGGRLLPAPEFLRGFPVAPGTVLPSQPMRPLVSARPFRPTG
ncbi:MAG: methionyl-tRNA formyltransferase [Opitutaceae bacterium]|nr:methionyl-tRNA formyltransferase [Opitutaceae bacterium]